MTGNVPLESAGKLSLEECTKIFPAILTPCNTKEPMILQSVDTQTGVTSGWAIPPEKGEAEVRERKREKKKNSLGLPGP